MKFDLHVHTEHSNDCRSSVRDVLNIAKKKGLHGLAFMDHNTLDAYWEAEDTELVIIPAVEISTPAGHVGALGVKDRIGKQPDVKTAITRISDLGGLAIALHPYRFWSGIGEKEVRNNRWGAIEGLNARTGVKCNLKAQRLADELKIPVIGGSDAHQLEYVGKGYTVVKNVNSWRDLLDEIKKGRTVLGGSHPSSKDTFRYVKKSVSEWIGRGFSRM